MRNDLAIAVLCAALGGCASSSAEITPAYISPVIYQSYSCQQLALEDVPYTVLFPSGLGLYPR